MSVLEAMLRSAMMLIFVFIVLVIIYFLIQLLTIVIKKIENKQMHSDSTTINQKSSSQDLDYVDIGPWGGELKLKDVDEQTAAIIMAIVSDESGIPLSELIFKRISLVKENNQINEEGNK